MSKLYARYIWDKDRCVEDKWSEAALSVPARIRYLKGKKAFAIDCLDVYEFKRSGAIEKYPVEVKEEDLLRMIKFDEEYKGDGNLDAREWMFYHKEVEGIEKGELDDGTYENVSVCQYFYTISRNVLKIVKRQSHLCRLKKVKSPWVDLHKRLVHSNGGRPKGSQNKSGSLDEKLARLKEYDADEYERLVYLRDNFEEIRDKCCRNGRIEEYLAMCKDLKRKASQKDFYARRKELIF